MIEHVHDAFQHGLPQWATENDNLFANSADLTCGQEADPTPPTAAPVSRREFEFMAAEMLSERIVVNWDQNRCVF